MGEMADFALDQMIDEWDDNYSIYEQEGESEFTLTKERPMANGNEIFNVMTPIQTDNGKTVWDKVGVAFPNSDPTKNHSMVLSLTSFPIRPDSPLKLFIYPQQNKQQSVPHPSSDDSGVPHPGDDVKF